jgi:predicted ester cyclase
METQNKENDLEFNKAFIINHFEEFVNKKNSAIAYVNLAEDFLDHDEANGPAIGPEPAKKMMEKMYTFFNDLHVSVEDIIAEGDKVMVRNIWSATTSDGKNIQFKGFVLWRLKDKKIVERWATVTSPQQQDSLTPQW